jgi:hypothetical protein
VHRSIALILAVCAACTSSSPATPADAGAGEGSAISCEHDTRAMTYAPNLSASANVTKVVLVDASPSPPARGTNTWTIKVTDAQGNAIPGATVTAKPFMPDHGHGSSVQPVVTANADGTFGVTPLYLFMPGLWQVTFTVKTASSSDDVVFSFCIAG